MTLTFFGKGRGGADGSAENGQVKFAAIQEVRAYWEALRDAGSLPRRDQIDPRGLASALEQVFLVEQIAPGQARFRLAGMHLSDLMGMDVRGMPLTSFYEPAARARLAEALDQMFAGQQVLDVWLEGERGIGRPALEGRMILLPLTGLKDEPRLALGCLSTVGGLGRAPRRFAISGLVREAVRVPVAEVAPQPVAGFADPSSAFARRALRGKPMLRLVSSND